MSVLVTRTPYRTTARWAGGPRLRPSERRMWRRARDRSLRAPDTSPSARGPPRWVQVLSSAKNWLSTLNRAICLPFTSTRRAWPG